jgi:hypothetical protein
VERLLRVVRHRVLRLLEKRGALRLERLCRDRARGALALAQQRLSRAEDGRIAWRMKRPLPESTTHLLFAGLEL